MFMFEILTVVAEANGNLGCTIATDNANGKQRKMESAGNITRKKFTSDWLFGLYEGME